MVRLDLVLYGTAGCHLCELAESEIFSALEPGSYTLERVDIALDATLLEQYGTRIPVLLLGRTTLDWPFDAARICQFTGLAPDNA